MKCPPSLRLLCALLVASAVLAFSPRRCFAQPTSSAALLTSQARRHAAEGDTLKARKRVSEALRLDPTFAAAWLVLAENYQQEGDWIEALRVYQAGLDHVADFVDAYRGRARLFERLGRNEEASRDLRAAVSVAPTDMTLRLDCIEFYIRRQAWSAALQQSRAMQLLLETGKDKAGANRARVRTLALHVLAAEQDPVSLGSSRKNWERRAIAAVGKRLGTL